MVLCTGDLAAQCLVNDRRLETFVLTGGTETAQRILHHRPELHLLAETGGKNATIVTSLCDRDMAIKNVLHSAFSHAGQKCSATSLLLLEEEVYHDAKFREALIDAVESMHVGPVWDLKTKMGPLIRPPQGALARGLKELEPGESWLLMPKNLNGNPCLWSPGIKWNARPGSFTHCTELFGPVLAVMPFRHLDEAIDTVVQTGYGLTSGLESLDDREQARWMSRMRAGNLYVNRPTTGAIVLRQPFGGMGKSAFGPGIKAGGPNYVVPLLRVATPAAPAEKAIATTPGRSSEGGGNTEVVLRIPQLQHLWEQLAESRSEAAQQVRQQLGPSGWYALQRALSDYDAFARAEIRRYHDTYRLIGQDNFRRYLPMTHLRIRLTPRDTWLDCLARIAAVVAVGGRAAVSVTPEVEPQRAEILEALTERWAADLEYLEETDEQLVEAIEIGQVDRLRYAGPWASPAVRAAADRQFIYVAEDPVQLCGRIELLWYVREQSVSIDYHRYGNLGARVTEPRREPW
ncbi:MAG: hypothetical protein KatS3mg111_2870 [Pirellulaceae bacterium]|nr:MAG: hypothetical protein KatS3mg111_2870 [Pirellulaceae bacterium]